jgi:thiol-disulfide isomerase/thioredoxin
LARAPRIFLILALLAVSAAGCSSVSGGRSGFANRWRTMASSGGSALPTETGPPGAAVAAELGAPEVASRATGRISGRVIDPKGKPVPNAEVRLADGSSKVGRDLRVTTDEAGGFTLHGLREGGSYTLIAEGDVGRDALVGRASARAPTSDLRIRLRPDADDSTTAENETTGTPGRRVGQVSTQSPVDPTDDDPFPTETPERKPTMRVNDDDLPPAAEVEPVDPSPDTEPAVGRKAPTDKVARTAWRRGTTDSGSAASVSEPLDRSGAAPKSAVAPKAVDENEKNPLPPAKERLAEPLSTLESRPSTAGIEAAKPSPPSLDPTEKRPTSDSAPAPEAPPSSPTSDSVAIPAEAAPKRRATWAEVASSPVSDTVAVAAPLPISTRRLPATGSTATPDEKAASGRLGILGLKGKKPNASGTPNLAASSCRFDPKTQRIVDFQLPDLDGKATRFQDFDADFVLIDFWGSWCKPCVGSIPHLVELQKRYGAKTLQVVGVATEQDGTPAEKADRVEQLARSLGVNYPLLMSQADGRPCPLQEDLHIQSYPTMILVDRTGKILWRGVGAEEITLARLDRVIAARADTAVLRR